MKTRIAGVVLALMVAVVATGCGVVGERPGATPEPAPVEAPAPDGSVSGSRLAAGLYDMEDGTVQAVGTLEYSDLEGGFWTIVGGTEAEGNVGEVVAVIANEADLGDVPAALEGRTVMAVGTRLEGASIRMAGPEIEVTDLTELSDTGGAAE